MGYTDTIDRTGADSLIPEDASREILANVPAKSAVLSLGRKLPNMPRAQRRMPVMSSLATAYFVTGDNGLKQTSKLEWGDKFLDAEELAVIVPIPESVLDDADYDIWGEVRPQLEEAFGVALDAAVIHGTNKPASWPTALLTAAIAAGNSVDLSSVIGASGDIYDAIMGSSGVIAALEADGYTHNGSVGHTTLRSKLRDLRDSTGQPIFTRSVQEAGRYELDGSPIFFPANGAIDSSTLLALVGDWTKLVWAFRQDITYKILDQAVIQDNTGAIVYNLAQQDMVALRAVMRIAVQVANPINRLQSVEANRYPFAALVP